MDCTFGRLNVERWTLNDASSAFVAPAISTPLRSHWKESGNPLTAETERDTAAPVTDSRSRGCTTMRMGSSTGRTTSVKAFVVAAPVESRTQTAIEAEPD